MTTHTHTIEVDRLERALDMPPVVQEWTNDQYNWFTLALNPSHRKYAIQIQTQAMALEEGRAVCTVTPEVWTVVHPRRTLAVGQCASVLAILGGIPAVGLLWNETLSRVLTAAALGILTATYLVASALKNWRG